MMPHLFADIPELHELGAGGPLIRIPMQQDVPFSRRVRALVDTAEFQRLAHIAQLGLAARVYPGATHTRFEHALGVFHNAVRYLHQLGHDARFASIVSPHQAEVLLAAALLHDLGHWPFCHPMEDMALPEIPRHEDFAREFLGPGTELSQVLADAWRIDSEEVLDVLTPRTDAPSLRLLRSILSGPIDIDKMDYLERDSLHCGVPYGSHFDRPRLVQSLVVNEAGDGLAITSKGKTAAELMVFARCVMFTEVYWHHAVRAATAMLMRLVFELRQELDVAAFCRSTDAEAIGLLVAAARGRPAAALADGLFGRKRRLHKRVLELTALDGSAAYRAIAGRPYAAVHQLTKLFEAECSRAIGRALPAGSLLIDAPPSVREVEFKVDVYFAKEQRYQPLARASPVVAALAQTQFDEFVKRVRVFATEELSRDLIARGNAGVLLDAALRNWSAS